MAVNLSEENKTLRKRINEIATDWQSKEVENQQLRNRMKELEEANKLLEADARRYRKLKDMALTPQTTKTFAISIWDGWIWHGYEKGGISLDIELDAMESKNDN